MMKPKKPQWYAVVKKILLRSLTVWFSIPPILPFDCSVKLDVPLVKLVAVKECHTRIINCKSIFLGTPGTPTQAEWLAKVRWISHWGYCLLAEASFPWYSSGGRKSPLNTREKGPLLARNWGMESMRWCNLVPGPNFPWKFSREWLKEPGVCFSKVPVTSPARRQFLKSKPFE